MAEHSATLCQLAQVGGRGKKLPEYYKFFSEFLSMKSQSVMIREEQRPASAKPKEDQQRMARRTNARALSTVEVYLYPFLSITYPLKFLFLENVTCYFFQAASRKTGCICSHQKILSHVCFSKTSSHVSASAKHPLIRQFPEKHHMAQLSLQRNQKFPLHIWQEYIYFCKMLAACLLKCLYHSTFLSVTN